MNLQEMINLARRSKEARDLRLATGMWLHATEMRLHDRDQLALLAEHTGNASAHTPSISPLLSGIPIYFDATVPAGIARIVLEDDSVREFQLG